MYVSRNLYTRHIMNAEMGEQTLRITMLKFWRNKFDRSQQIDHI